MLLRELKMKKWVLFLILFYFFFFESCAPPSSAKEDSLLSEPQKVARSRNGVVTTAHPLATKAGIAMLEQGGNAADAAVAAAYALAVVEPSMSGIGGRAQILIHTSEGEIHGIDATTQAPSSYDHIPEPKAKYGYPTIGIPGVVAGLDKALKSYGSLPREIVMGPAIKYAKEGRSLGLGLVAATQQPSALDSKLTSQVNVLVCHGLQLASDVTAVKERILNDMADEIYLDDELVKQTEKLTTVLRNLNRGEALISSSAVNRTFFLQVRPRISAHGGAPAEIK